MIGLVLAIIFLVMNPFLLVIVAQYIDFKRDVKEYGEDIARDIAKRW